MTAWRGKDLSFGSVIPNRVTPLSGESGRSLHPSPPAMSPTMTVAATAGHARRQTGCRGDAAA